jgi:hypothetical protein
MTNQLRWELLESVKTAQNQKFKALKDCKKSRRRFRKLKSKWREENQISGRKNKEKGINRFENVYCLQKFRGKQQEAFGQTFWREKDRLAFRAKQQAKMIKP